MGIPLLLVWVIGLLPTFYSPRRHGWLEWATRTEVRYTVHAESAAIQAAVRARKAAEALANQ
jgi:deoxycytidylate deaminase